MRQSRSLSPRPARALAAALLALALLIDTGAPRAQGKRHPPVGAGASCVTRQCHERLLAAAQRGGSVHEPAAGGECASCHDLALPVPAPFVRGAPVGGDGPEPARPWDLALCTGCHDAGLFTGETPPGATGFADGRRNLHALHVQAARGRRCLTCHDPHAARQPSLLRRQIPARGAARIAQEFRGDPQGGWCKTGCHAPKSYRR